MSLIIILTEEQASLVAGETTPGNVLEPMQLSNGSFFLPVEVLEDSAHERYHNFLALLPQQEYSPPEEE